MAQDDKKPWVEKYRPKDLKDVESHYDIIATGNISIL